MGMVAPHRYARCFRLPFPFPTMDSDPDSLPYTHTLLTYSDSDLLSPHTHTGALVTPYTYWSSCHHIHTLELLSPHTHTGALVTPYTHRSSCHSIHILESCVSCLPHPRHRDCCWSSASDNVPSLSGRHCLALAG